MDLPRQLTVAICTHNRGKDLQSTVVELKLGELAQCPLLIGDDASDTPVAAFGLRDWNGDLRVLRSAERLGLIRQRNLLVAEARTPFVLILDDDSSPLTEGISEVLTLFSEPQVAAVGMPVQLLDGSWQIEPAGWGSRRKAYFGCAHILRRESFLSLGGYRGELVHQGEEKDFGIRALAAGMACLHANRPIVEHRLSPQARSFDRMDFYGSRNDLLFVDWYAPASIWVAEIARALARRFAHYFAHRRQAILRGIYAWAKERRSFAPLRKATTVRQWKNFHQLPY